MASVTPLGIYIHIPYCLSKCAYCDFYSKCGTKGEYDEYTKALCRHIEEADMRASDYEADSIYFGGGTPTAIGAKNLIKILSSVRRSFKVSADCEITTEANPNSVDFGMLKKLRKKGFNRISFGMQSAKSSELRVLGRTHTFEDVKAHYEAGADYIGCGPFRFTTTKEKLSPILGLEGYKDIIQKMKEESIDIPLVAIGGITKEDIPEIMKTGVNGIALSGCILHAENPAEETREILALL